MPLPIIAWVCYTCIAAGATYCVHKISNSYNKKEKNKKRKLDQKGKLIDKAREDNEAAKKESDEWKKKYDENEGKIKDLEKKIEDAKKNANDLTLPEDERTTWKIRVAQYEDEIKNLRKNNTSILEKIKGIGKRMKDNNDIISGTASNLDEKHWISELFTLENIMIGIGCYMVYKMLKDDKK